MHVTITFDLQPNGVKSGSSMAVDIRNIIRNIADLITGFSIDTGTVYDANGKTIGSYMAMDVGDE